MKDSPKEYLYKNPQISDKALEHWMDTWSSEALEYLLNSYEDLFITPKVYYPAVERLVVKYPQSEDMLTKMLQHTIEMDST